MIPQVGVWAFILLGSVASFEEVRFTSVFEQQTDSTCGIASAASLASIYWGINVTEEVLVAYLRNRGVSGAVLNQSISLYELQLLLEYLGFDTGGFGLNYTQLIHAAGKYGPLICHLSSEEGHFVLFFGEAYGFVLLGDPALGCIAVSKPEFLSRWSHSALAVFHSQKNIAGTEVARVLIDGTARVKTLVSWSLR